MNKSAACSFLFFIFSASAASACDHTNATLFRDPSCTFEERAKNLVSLMTLDEKVSQMNHDAPAIPHLGLRAYYGWNEGLHGTVQNEQRRRDTVYPQIIGLASTWDTQLIHQVSGEISDEARATYEEENRGGGSNNGLNIFAPNINIFRDPRWGRGQETYGEDPYLTSRLSVEYIKGLQGDDPKYLKVAATPKHFAVHSGPEALRESGFTATPTDKDLQETYLPAFEAAIREGNAASIMCSYNSIQFPNEKGLPACANPTLLTKILRTDWGFQGAVVSDCGAIGDISQNHYARNPTSGAVKALRAGTDLACNADADHQDYRFLAQAVREKKLSVEELDASLARLLVMRFRFGIYDPSAMVSYSNLSYATVDGQDHRNTALQAARESMVLLKNSNKILPLQTKALKKISVIGPSADNERVLLANYHGESSHYVSAFAGIKQKLAKAAPQASIVYDKGDGDVAAKVAGSDVVILVLGLHSFDDAFEKDSPSLLNVAEGENRDRTQGFTAIY